MVYSYPAVIIKEKGKYWAYIPDIPGVYGLGKSPEESKKDIAKAIKLYIEDCLASGNKVPKSLAQVVGIEEVSVTVGK